MNSHYFNWETRSWRSRRPRARADGIRTCGGSRPTGGSTASTRPRYAQLLASKHERGPGIEQGEELEAAEVPDRAAAIALAHQYLDRHAEEAVGRTTLEVHIRPPARELRRPELYEVPPEVVAQARQLGLKGDVAAQIKRMVGEADLGIDQRGNLKTQLDDRAVAEQMRPHSGDIKQRASRFGSPSRTAD